MVGLLKFVLGSEIRVVSEIPNSFKDLQETCSELFGVNNPCFQYKDIEDDLITFSTDKEFQFILASLQSNLKLIVMSSTYLLANSPRLQFKHGFPVDNNTESPLMLHIPSLNPIPLQKSSKSVPNNIKSYIVESDYRNFTPNYNKSGSFESDHSNSIPNNIKSSHSNTPELKSEKSRKDFLSETLRKSLPIETINSKKLFCTFCKTEINDMLFVCLQCNKHLMCSECEANDSRKHILIKCKLKDVYEVLKIKIDRKNSFHLVKKNKEFDESLNGDLNENEEDFKVENSKDTKGKEETLKGKIKKETKKKIHTSETADHSSKKITKDAHITKKKASFTKKHDEHENHEGIKKEGSRSFNENDSSDDYSEKKTTKPGVVKSSPLNQNNNPHKINALMERLKMLGFVNKTQNYNALVQAKYQLEDAINILLNCSEKS